MLIVEISPAFICTSLVLNVMSKKLIAIKSFGRTILLTVFVSVVLANGRRIIIVLVLILNTYIDTLT